MEVDTLKKMFLGFTWALARSVEESVKKQMRKVRI